MQFIASRHSGLLFQFDHAAFRSAGDPVFPDTHWRVETGECWGLVGGRDSGRNLLVHALRGELPPMGGEVIYGYGALSPVLRDLPESGIAHVLFEDLRLEMNRGEAFAQLRWNPNLERDPHRVSDFLSLESVDGLVSRQDAPPIRQRRYRALFRPVMRLFGIEPLLARDLDTVSNGERRKIFLARAVLRDPVLLILEHPFEGMDAAYHAQLRRILRELHHHGLNLMFLATDLAELPSMVNRVAVVRDFRLERTGPRRGMRPPRSTDRARRVNLPSSWRETLNRNPHRHPVAELRGVTIRYGQRDILRGISWTVHPGECWGVSGPNGAGKSTLLSLLQADNPQAYGEDIRMFGQPYGPDMPAWKVRERIGSVSPETHLYFPGDLPVLDAVCSGFTHTVYPPDRIGRTRRRIAVDWLAALGLAHTAAWHFGELSEEAQRLVLLARAVVRPVDLLILDEPAMGLDDAGRARLLHLVTSVVRASRCALVYVTHRPEEFPACITRRLHLRDGRVTRTTRRGSGH